jgi:hypothetical protein
MPDTLQVQPLSPGRDIESPSAVVTATSVTAASVSSLGGAKPSDAPKPGFWEQAPNLGLLLVLVCLAIAAVSEISSRNDDYGRVTEHKKWLLGCLQTSASDKACPKDAFLSEQLDVATTQVRRYDSLNSAGTRTRCLTAPVIASPLPGFYESCLAYVSGVEVKPPARTVMLKPIVEPPWWSSDAAPLQMDQRPKEHIYFFLVLVASAIGALIGGLRATGFTTIRDLTLGLGAGFAVYLVLRSGNFASLTGSANIDILNPFSAGAVGMAVGLFSERVFRLVDGLVGSRMGDAADKRVVVAEESKVTATVPAAR